MIESLLPEHGEKPFGVLTRKIIKAEMKARTPSQAGNLLSALRGMIRWMIDEGHLDEDDDPTESLKTKAKASRESGGFLPWTEEDMALYRTKWPHGTEARLMFDILHHTFLRLGDAHRFGPPHLRQIVRKMAVQIATEKSRGNTTVTVPVHPEFAESLRAARAAGIVRAEVFTGKFVKGRVLPMNKKAWAAKFKKFAVLAGVNESKKSCHGVRKARAEVAVRRLHREPDDGDVWLDRPRCPRTTSRGRIEIVTEFLVVRIAKSPTNPLRRLFGAGSPSWISLYNAKEQIAHRCLERIVPHSA